MNKTELYETALLKMAKDGNAEAELILRLGALTPSQKTVDADSVAEDLRGAITNLGNALRLNGHEWCSGTDYEINYAVSKITSAMSRLI
jgi:hypothetical protein